jgi:hypothetical protein
MNALEHVRMRLQQISATAGLAAEALDGGSVDLMPPELERFAHQLERVLARLEDITDRLAVGLDPQRAPR